MWGILCFRICILRHCGSILKISETSLVVNSVISSISYKFQFKCLFFLYIFLSFFSFWFFFFSFFLPQFRLWVHSTLLIPPSGWILSSKYQELRVHPYQKDQRETEFRCNHTTEDSTSLDSYRVQGVSPQEREYAEHLVIESLVSGLCLYPLSLLIKRR